MKAKTNLKAVEVSETGQGKMYQYDNDQMSDIAAHLYSARAALDVFSCLDTDQPDAFENGAICNVALDARERIEAALKILEP